jgi:hypothetical protein
MTPATLPPPTATSMLVRVRGEPLTPHRALLVYAMAGERRSFAVAAKALQRSDATIRTWARKWEWDRRCRETPSADTEAYVIYQRTYLPKHGAKSVVRLMKLVVEPLGFLAMVDASMLEQDEKAHTEAPEVKRDLPPPALSVAMAPKALERKARAPAPPPVERQPDPDLTSRVTAALGLGSSPEVLPAGTFSPPAPAGPPRDLSLERDIKLLDGALGYCAQALKDGKVPVTLSGIASLLKTKQLLLGRSTANVAVVVQSTGPAPVPTVRVQQAQSDAARLAAYREDVADLATILDGIEAGAERDAEIVTTGDERERA